MLIIGDFNFEEMNWNTCYTPSSETALDLKFIEKMRDCYLFQRIMKQMRSRIDQELRILDLVLSNEESMVSDI